MRILIVGGTGFLGGATARAAVDAGHDVTVMSRSGRNVAPGAATLIADRNDALPDLSDQFDAVIDTCAYTPDMVQRLAAALGSAHYVLVSSISVYAEFSEPNIDEMAPAPEATAADLDLAAGVAPDQRAQAGAYGADYGPLKRSCELAASAFGDRASLIRLGLIVGPEDYTDRLTWWVRRCDQGGTMAVPEPRDRLIQLIDVADAADFMLHLAEQQQPGTFNLTGRPVTMETLLAEIMAKSGTQPDLRWTPLHHFTEAELSAWSDLPLIVPAQPSFAHMQNISTTRVQAAGLTCRPLRDTIRRTLAWDRDQRQVPLKSGMTPEAERAVLDAVAAPRT